MNTIKEIVFFMGIDLLVTVSLHYVICQLRLCITVCLSMYTFKKLTINYVINDCHGDIWTEFCTIYEWQLLLKLIQMCQ